MHWFFNTDESENEGKGAYERMILQSCIAAWGDCRGKGAEELLNTPSAGDRVFLYLAGYGVVASGIFTDELSSESTTIFQAWGEYQRPLSDLEKLPVGRNVLSPEAILEMTGYHVPARHILCRIRNTSAAKMMESYFNKS